jgi:hypothetical protein
MLATLDGQEEPGIRTTKPSNPYSTRAHPIQYVRGSVHSFHGFWRVQFSRILTRPATGVQTDLQGSLDVLGGVVGEFSTSHFPYTVENENDRVYALQYAAFQKAVENRGKPFSSALRSKTTVQLRLALVGLS